MTALEVLFGGQSSDCQKSLDANDDGSFNIADVIHFLAHVFSGGADPTAPFPNCGPDTNSDPLDCTSFSGG